MDKAMRNAIGDGVVEACTARYQQLLGALAPQLGEREGVELVLSAACAALVKLWQGCCRGEEEVVRNLLIEEINKHYRSTQSREPTPAE